MTNQKEKKNCISKMICETWKWTSSCFLSLYCRIVQGWELWGDGCVKKYDLNQHAEGRMDELTMDMSERLADSAARMYA